VDIIFHGRRTSVQERFREYATAKLGKVVKLDQKTISIDVEVTLERNPRQSAQRERVELTLYSRGPVMRAEAAADDRFMALDRALAKLETHLRRAGDRRKARNTGHSPTVETGTVPDLPVEAMAVRPARATPAGGRALAADGDGAAQASESDWPETDVQLDGIVPIPMEGNGPLVVREKFHSATPMTIDRALHEMELVGHDFFLFRDETCHLPSVVYRRRGYNYGVIRLVEGATTGLVHTPARRVPVD
jgi:ribosomal subunit interface protein